MKKTKNNKIFKRLACVFGACAFTIVGCLPFIPSGKASAEGNTSSAIDITSFRPNGYIASGGGVISHRYSQSNFSTHTVPTYAFFNENLDWYYWSSTDYRNGNLMFSDRGNYGLGLIWYESETNQWTTTTLSGSGASQDILYSFSLKDIFVPLSFFSVSQHDFGFDIKSAVSFSNSDYSPRIRLFAELELLDYYGVSYNYTNSYDFGTFLTTDAVHYSRNPFYFNIPVDPLITVNLDGENYTFYYVNKFRFDIFLYYPQIYSNFQITHKFKYIDYLYSRSDYLIFNRAVESYKLNVLQEADLSNNEKIPELIFGLVEQFFDIEIVPYFKVSYLLLLGIAGVVVGLVIKVFLHG